MQNLDALRQELEKRGKADALRSLADSADGQRLKGMIDGSALAEAAKKGDSAALQQLLGGLLKTEEGRRLAENVKKLMGK